MIKRITYLICFLFFISFLSAAEQKDINKKKMRFFCLDFHGAVSADIKGIFEELGHEVVVWILPSGGISYARWAIGREEDPVEIFNYFTWINANKEMYEQFYERYKDFLDQFDGFISVYNSSFAPIYEKFNKPIIIVNAIRYEIPFTNRPDMWSWLNEFLIRGVKRNQIFIVANNKGDRAYLKHYTDLDSKFIPSLCLYTDASYTGNRSTFLCHPSNRYGQLAGHVIKEYPQLIGNDLPRPYTWKDLCDYKGLIHFPYQNSTMSIFEQYSANIPLFFPSRKFIVELQGHSQEVLRELSYFYFFGKPFSSVPTDDLNNLANPDIIQFWLDNSDFYDKKNMPYIQFFDSFDHLKNLLETVDCQAISQKMKKHNKKRKSMVLRKWKALLEAVSHYSEN